MRSTFTTLLAAGVTAATLLGCGDDGGSDSAGSPAAGGQSSGSGGSAAGGMSSAGGSSARGSSARGSSAGGDGGGGEGQGGDGQGGDGQGGSGGSGGSTQASELVACGATPLAQSPTDFATMMPMSSGNCSTEGTSWLPCHQHIHCGPEHTGAGICGEALCEVHTVHRQKKDGTAPDPVADIKMGSLGMNCDPTNHDLMVRATFVSAAAECMAGEAAALT